MRTSLRGLIRSSAILAAWCAVTCAALPASASDHQDTVYLAEHRPGADLTDVFLFPAADRAKVVLAMDVHPLIPQGMATSASFDPAVLYQFKIAHDKSYVEDQVIQFRAAGVGETQRITVYGPGTPPGGPGTMSRIMARPMGSVAYNGEASLPGGVRVFAGPRKDPFYFDLAQFLKIIPDRDYKQQPHAAPPQARCFRTPGVDTLSDYNVLSLIIELPRAMLANKHGALSDIRVWSTTSIAPSGSERYEQIERLSRPAIKEVFETFKDHDTTNRSAPTSDALLAGYIKYFSIHTAGRSAAVANALVKTLIPDELTANLGASGHAAYLAVETGGKSGLPVGIVRIVPNGGIEGIKKALSNPLRQFGGRDPDSNVVDLSLGAIFGSIIPKVGLAPNDHHETACLTSDHVKPMNHNTKTFPYIGPPI